MVSSVGAEYSKEFFAFIHMTVISNVIILGSLLGQPAYIDFIQDTEPRDVFYQRT